MHRRLRTLANEVIAVAVFSGCAAVGAEKSRAIEEKTPERVHPLLEMMPVPAGLGVNIHFYKGGEIDWRMIEDAGIGMVRMDVSWDAIERKPGEYDFTQHDQLVKDIEQRGMRLLFIIDYGNRLYDKGLAPFTGEGRAAYARFCAVLAGRYAGKKIIWELWNEPNIDTWKPKPNVKDYLAWCKVVVPAIRQADPNACVIGPATSTIPMPFLEACFKDGFLELVDGVSVHPYRDNTFGPETVLKEYGRLRVLIDRYRPVQKAIPIVSGEWGYSTAKLAPETQGKYLARQWLANMSAGVPISIWYDWHDDGPDPKEHEHNFGTVRNDYRPKPAYIAMRTLVGELRGYRVAGRVDLRDDNDFAVIFRKGEDVKLAIWTVGKPHEIDLGSGIGVRSAVDHLGQSAEVPTGARQAVTDAPKYLTLSSMVPR